ncbi:MAG: hypothetical protein AB7V07_06555 [Candidatus Delongbacteria bacterium]|jgi:hypothetical protein
MNEPIKLSIRNKDLINSYFLILHNKTDELRVKLIPKISAIENCYGKDNKIIILTKLPLSAIAVQLLMCKSLVSTFYNHEWWDEINMKNEGRELFKKNHETFLNIFFLVNFFSNVESALRELIQKLHHGACDDGKSNFESIYKMILSRLGLKKYLCVFDLMSIIRNSIHTNGIYRPSKSDKNRTVECLGKKFEFDYNKPINIFYPELTVEIEEQVFDCLIEILNHKEIKKLK